MNKIVNLSWDSDFFNRKIGQIHLTTSEDISQFEKEFLSNSFDLVYVTTEDKILTKQFSEIFLIEPIEYKRTYFLYDTPSIFLDIKRDCIEINTLDKRIIELAYQSGVESRFYKDSKIGKTNFENLYHTWIAKSVKGELANHVLGVQIEGELAGFVTLSFSGECAQIGLIAVHQNYRGQGIAKSLIEQCIIKTNQIDKMPLKVVTQAHNIGACRLYESMGFKEQSSIALFHIWKE